MNLYFVNTDNGRQSPAEWLSRRVAVATDSEANMRALSKVMAGDGVLAYENGIGIVAVGRALAGGVREIRDPAGMVNGNESVEYHLPVHWETDLRHAPISHTDVRRLAGVQPVRTCQQVHQGKEWILNRLRELSAGGLLETSVGLTRAPATSSAGPTGTSIAITIEWEETIEIIPLALDALEPGAWLDTVETWKDGTEPTTYRAHCTCARKGSDGWFIELFYDRKHRTNNAIALQYPDLEWGTVTLNVNKDVAAATASFQPDNGAPAGAGTCAVMRTGLYASLTRAQVNVLLRPGQAALREKLLARYTRCAVSNENAKDALEAAHIIDHSAGGSASIGNAILLRADIHALFDAGKLNIDENGFIQLVGLPSDSRYHKELATRWNKRLTEDVRQIIQQALAERAGGSKAAKGSP